MAIAIGLIVVLLVCIIVGAVIKMTGAAIRDVKSLTHRTPKPKIKPAVTHDFLSGYRH